MLVLVETNDLVPGDGEIVQGIASVNESAITGESAPVIREAGGDRSAVTGGTMVVSDSIVVRITADPGNTFIDRMIALVEGAERRKTPNEIALDILLAGLTIIFLIAVVTLVGLTPVFGHRHQRARAGGAAGDPDPDHDRRIAVGHRHRRHGPPGALQRGGHVRPRRGGGGRRGTPCCWTRRARSPSATACAPGCIRCPAWDERVLAEAAAYASLGDETPEGRSVVTYVRDRYSLSLEQPGDATVVPFNRQHPRFRAGCRRSLVAQGRGGERGRDQRAAGVHRGRSTAWPAPAARRWR